LLPEKDHSGDAAVTIDSVSKVFNGRHGKVAALDNISLSVAPGEFVCLLGASGCGKSTLLNLISELDFPTSGTVTSVGRPALMFQEAALFPWLTAGQNIALALKYADVPKNKRKAKINELLDLVRLSGHADRRVHELSGGQRQRVALARALGQNSDVLLMDEPFAALDAITRDVMHDELTRVWKETGNSIVFVTHNVREAVRLGQRVVLLSSRPAGSSASGRSTSRAQERSSIRRSAPWQRRSRCAFGRRSPAMPAHNPFTTGSRSLQQKETTGACSG
jgi:NitT/TauT family transport system ATP-binding protein